MGRTDGVKPTRMRFEEGLAMEILRETALYTEVTFQEDQSSRVADFTLRRHDGAPGAAEVTTLTDREALETYHAARGTRISKVRSAQDWLVFVEPWARIARLKRHADGWLAQLEEAGITRVDSGGPPDHAAALDLLAAGVFSAAYEYKWKRPGIYLLGPAVGGKSHQRQARRGAQSAPLGARQRREAQRRRLR